MAKDPAKMPDVAAVLYHCAEALRIAANLLAPAMPAKMSDVLTRLGQQPPRPDGSFARPLSELCAWGLLTPGTKVTKGEGLFPRADPAAPPPGASAP
jgi:methionyl-tRNA synthetase